MGVYLWTDSLEINSDLVNSSLDQLKSEGWDDVIMPSGSGGYTIGAEGLKWGGSSAANNQQIFLYKKIPSLGDDIVELNWEGSGTRAYSSHNWQYNCFVAGGLYDLYNSTLDIAHNNFQGGYNTGTNDHGYIGINNGRTLLGNTSTTFTGGTIKITTKLNLKTGLIEYTCSAPISFTSSYTLSSSDLALLRTYKYVTIGGMIYEGGVNYITISKVSLKVTPV